MNKFEKALVRQRRKTIAGYVLLGAMIVLGTVGYVGGKAWLISVDQTDRPELSQDGTVVSYIPNEMTENNPGRGAVITVKIGAGQSSFKSFANYYVGEKVKVDFTVGHSGILYIDNVVAK